MHLFLNRGCPGSLYSVLQYASEYNNLQGLCMFITGGPAKKLQVCGCTTEMTTKFMCVCANIDTRMSMLFNCKWPPSPRLSPLSSPLSSPLLSSPLSRQARGSLLDKLKRRGRLGLLLVGHGEVVVLLAGVFLHFFDEEVLLDLAVLRAALLARR